MLPSPSVAPPTTWLAPSSPIPTPLPTPTVLPVIRLRLRTNSLCLTCFFALIKTSLPRPALLAPAYERLVAVAILHRARGARTAPPLARGIFEPPAVATVGRDVGKAGWTVDDDRLLLYHTALVGVGQWSRLQRSIRRDVDATFDYFLQSRSVSELERLVVALIREILRTQPQQHTSSVSLDEKKSRKRKDQIHEPNLNGSEQQQTANSSKKKKLNAQSHQ